MSDISKVLRPADILGVPQAIKGFDKSDFCDVFSIFTANARSEIRNGYYMFACLPGIDDITTI